ncbi:MAG: hypothetical protein QXP70_02050 [Methanomassiliicoccales archaeon]
MLSFAVVASSLTGFYAIGSYMTETHSNVVVTYEHASLSMGMNVIVNLKNNSLYAGQVIENPNYIFKNITNNVEIVLNMGSSIFPQNYSLLGIRINEIAFSGTSPTWNKTYFMNITSKKYYSQVSLSFVLPTNFSSTLTAIANTDAQLNITPGNPTILYQALATVYSNDMILTNATYLYMNFSYPSNPFGLGKFNALNYSYIQLSGKQQCSASVSRQIDSLQPTQTDPNPQFLYVGAISFLIAISAVVLAAKSAYRRKPVIEKFRNEFKDSMIRSRTNPLHSNNRAICVDGTDELKKLIDATGLPPMIYSNDLYDIVFVMSGDIVYYLKLKKRRDQE